MERRALAVEVRTKGRRLEGYAALFGVEARIADDFDEVIMPGAFGISLKGGKDIVALVDHDVGRVLARTKSGTLRLGEDSKGLHFNIDVPDTSAGRDVLALAERGDLGGASFGFVPIDERWEDDRRELRSIDLREVSIVSSWPAYEGTTVQARSRRVVLPMRVMRAKRFLESV